jgi:hypothetical protein
MGWLPAARRGRPTRAGARAVPARREGIVSARYWSRSLSRLAEPCTTRSWSRSALVRAKPSMTSRRYVVPRCGPTARPRALHLVVSLCSSSPARTSDRGPGSNAPRRRGRVFPPASGYGSSSPSRVIWAPEWSQDRIEAGRDWDRHRKDQYYSAARLPDSSDAATPANGSAESRSHRVAGRAECSSFRDSHRAPTSPARLGRQPQPSCPCRPDDRMARTRRKSNRARSTSDAALLLL